jgi:adenylate cyclase
MSDEQREAASTTSGLASTAHTFLFADLAGFAALTEAHGDEEAADLVGSFRVQVSEMLPQHGAEQVKTIGDALMILTASATNAVRLAVRIVNEVGGRHRFPAVRVGLHTGPAVAREDDWFGATVNLASRVSEVAAAGEVLLTDATRSAAAHVEGVEFSRWDRARFKNVREPVELWAAAARGRRKPSGRLEIDPLCRMAVARERAARTARLGARTVYFCSEACASAFSHDPESFAILALARLPMNDRVDQQREAFEVKRPDALRSSTGVRDQERPKPT